MIEARISSFRSGSLRGHKEGPLLGIAPRKESFFMARFLAFPATEHKEPRGFAVETLAYIKALFASSLRQKQTMPVAARWRKGFLPSRGPTSARKVTGMPCAMAALVLSIPGWVNNDQNTAQKRPSVAP
ncbi:hypothetical protein KM043_014761 [Ampulex compressa]|nr:hypothetical protein KM043_014761 [Ampulex compressa]